MTISDETVIYRDKVTHSRILVPIDSAKFEGVAGYQNPERWSVECVEITDWRESGFMNARKTFMPVTVLERYYTKVIL